MPYPKSVRIVEVGPRDGLQNEAGILPTAVKVDLIDRLARAGARTIEVGSFVSPKWVPQMADTAEVLKRVEHAPGVVYQVLVPNLKGLEAALACGVKEVAVFAAASEAFSQKNINCAVDESLRRFEPVLALAKEQGVKVRGYVSCALGSPFGDEVTPRMVADLASKLAAMGCYEVSLGDTIGTGTPVAAARMVEAVLGQVPAEQVALHFHDTYGQGLANILACLPLGVTVLDSSVSGLGGCPYAPGASGNVATEDLVYMLQGMGIETGLDLDLLVAASLHISKALGRRPVARVAQARALRVPDPGKAGSTGG